MAPGPESGAAVRSLLLTASPPLLGRIPVIAAASAALLLLVACGDDGGGAEGPSDETLEQALMERHGADPEQAGCIAEYLRDDYDAAELTVIVDDGVGALPQARWETYLTASLACLTRPLEEDR